ncbi:MULTISPECIES: hydantoinase/oxoprolinase family protein [unclassified Chelatococcus]|uniref:hydantoinase/oxoprolinase family protein n=1 Tax=unclassified Chelatococcus TaxID=2638111 RepID=UPI001BCD5AC4|nr:MULTISPECIES: hydantoinase/oxoprolinase family protein [unclassified Chelatococcus]MBS7699576.1 hydantoinase/oxoprolinase family protein [Chelatococcus sp. YT9]MBX3557224.1 hydantoinase/oxoprolinase family protein [Chelatococcus sp.]
MVWRIGVDSGGTFTDVCMFEDNSGEVVVWKVSSTPDDPSRGISEGVQQGIEKIGIAASAIAYLGHGTTVGTNALIQHKGVKTGLVTTEGFRDLLEIGRQKRPDLYDLNADKPEVLVARSLRLEVPERVRHDGRIETALDETAVREAAKTLKEAGVAAVAISFLYGFVRAEHEARVLEILKEELPDVFLSAGHEVAPEFREYERMSTAVVNAYLGPVMEKYIHRLASRLKELGLKVAPHLTQSNGGVIGFEQAARLPVRTVLSGPSTGVVAAQAIGQMTGMERLITFDMGGTSTDVALLHDGQCRLTSEAIVHGYPIKAPMLDIHTVGAGGGSIAHIDTGGLLKVGPQSCGAFPGPVCYDKGSTEPAVTDANVVLQTLNPTHLLAGRMAIRQDLSKAAIGLLAEKLGMDVMATAQGIISVVTANMARAIRVISVQRGHDPRDYALAAFGGAGPLHAARLARELDMKRILVPRYPGILCAMGLLLTDLRADFATTRLMVLKADILPTIEEAFVGLLKDADGWLENEGILPASRRLTRTVDMRYQGQNYELSIPLPDGPVTKATLDALAAGFEAAHKRMYGFIAEGETIQLVTFRVEAAGVVRKARFEPMSDQGTDASSARVGSREVWMPEAGGFVTCPVYSREALATGNRIEGPAIVEQMDTTTVVLPGMSAHVDPYLNLILEDA